MIRGLTAADFGMMNSWRARRGLGEIDPDLLPETAYAVGDLVIGFLYLTNSGAAWIENLISNPDAPVKQVAEAIDELIEALVAQAKQVGVKQIFAMTNKASMKIWVERLGFEAGEDNFTALTRRV